MTDVERHTLEMVQMADEGGFGIAWAAEHHALEMTIAPNPFQILTWWAAHTSRIRLGSAVVVAAYWHPIKAAGEAALLDLYSGGRLEFGIGSGAYQREFDRMHPGLMRNDGFRYMFEMLPAVKALWQGDYAHEGEFWSFPAATSVPKPLQKPHPPIWIAARSPDTYDFAGEARMQHPLLAPDPPDVGGRGLQEAHGKPPWPTTPASRGRYSPPRATRWCTIARRSGKVPVKAAIRQFGQFENLFMNLGDVADGFPRSVAFSELENRDEYDPRMLHDNLLFGTPEEVIVKLRVYETLGVDQFTYYASLGLGMKEQKRSLELFIKDVMPAFA